MPTSRRPSRRQFIQHTALGASALALGGSRLSLAQSSALPSPANSGIDHVIVVMMENRSYDHFLGWVPGSDGRQAGLTYVDAAGGTHATHRLAPDFQGCGHPDPDHSFAGGRIEYNLGACDGWLRAGQNDDYAIGYYTNQDLAFFNAAVSDWTTCDRYFSPIMAATFPNRFYMHAAQTDRLDNSFAPANSPEPIAPSTLPTIWDRLSDANLTGRYYFSDVPFLALWGAKYLPIARPFIAFLSDCAAGTLPQVSFVEPRFLEESTGVSSDDHPHADIRNGQAFLNRVYSAVVKSPAFERTVLVINYDEWGGFFDHVPPPSAPCEDAAIGNDGLLGFRVPAIVVSSMAGKRVIASATLDHTSILRMIEWRWSLAPLTARDANATNLAEILDFQNPKAKRKLYHVPQANLPTLCAPGELDKWETVRAMAGSFGWLG
jgi:phospholipase C